MKKIFSSIVILLFICLSNIVLAEDNLFDKLFDPNYTFDTNTKSTVNASA